MNTRGRPTKFTPETRKTIKDALALGSSRDMACQAAGIDTETLRQWLLRGQREKHSEYSVFLADLKIAEGQRVTRWLAYIEQAASTGNWQAAAWKLERLYPHLFSKSATEVPAMLEAILAKISRPAQIEVLEAAGVMSETKEASEVDGS